jgi:hypothetical protein
VQPGDKSSTAVDFCEGVIEVKPGTKLASAWACTPFGIVALLNEESDELHAIEPDQILDSTIVTTVDLPGLDRAGMDTIVGNILRGGYLRKPNIKDKGEAILFILVNEAIHQLEAVSDKDIPG